MSQSKKKVLPTLRQTLMIVQYLYLYYCQQKGNQNQSSLKLLPVCIVSVGPDFPLEAIRISVTVVVFNHDYDQLLFNKIGLDMSLDLLVPVVHVALFLCITACCCGSLLHACILDLGAAARQFFSFERLIIICYSTDRHTALHSLTNCRTSPKRVGEQ
jgi:hypothetical protein